MGIFQGRGPPQEPVDELLEALRTLNQIGKLHSVEDVRQAVERLVHPDEPVAAAFGPFDEEEDVDHVLRRFGEHRRRELFDRFEELRRLARAGLLIIPPVPGHIADRLAARDAAVVRLSHEAPHHLTRGRPVLAVREARRLLQEGKVSLVLLDGYRGHGGALVRGEVEDFLGDRVPADCALAIHDRPHRDPDDVLLGGALCERVIWV